MRFLPLAAAAALTLAGFANDWTKAKPAHVTVEPVPLVTLKAGKTAASQVRFRVAERFHINSSKPTSDLLIPTVLKVSGPSHIRIGAVQYPAGKPFIFAAAPNEKLDVYSGEVELDVPISAAKSAKPGTYKLHGELRYQACDDSSCFPPRTIALEMPVIVTR